MQISTSSPAAGTATAGKPSPQGQADLQKAAKSFEAIFMRQMIGAMRSASLDEGLGDSGASEQFRDMADARTADAMAESGHGFGIAALLLKQFGGTPATAAASALTKAAIGEAKP